MTHLNLNNFPTVENSIGLLAFNHLEEFPSLANLGDITQRIYGCSNFLYYKVDEKNPYWVESAYLRAALNEFASISEMIKSSANPKLYNLTIDKSNLPLLHFFKLLRDVNFHLNSLHHAKVSKEVRSFSKITGKIDDMIFNLDHTIIDELNISIFQKSKNLKHYDSTELDVVTKWVNKNQYHWGIFHILDLALRQYCAEIQKYCC